jgi:hypothetical protein
LELILAIRWDRGVKVWRRGFFPFSRFTEKRGGGSGGGIPPSPRVPAPYVIAYVIPFTIHSGEGSGGTSNWGRGWSPLPRFGGSGRPSIPCGILRVAKLFRNVLSEVSRGSNFGITHVCHKAKNFK